jgi:TIR domain
MTAFISYARRDAEAVAQLHDDLERSKRDVWFDRELDGGQKWWDAIVENIRSCDLFVLVLSPFSLASRACRAELNYAVALDRPILPVMVREINPDLLPDSVGSTHMVDYRERTADSAFALVLALGQVGAAPPLPDLLPAPPPAPMSDLGPIRDRLMAPELEYAEQQEIVRQLKSHLGVPDQHETLLALAVQLRARPELVETVGRDLDVLISSIPSRTTTGIFRLCICAAHLSSATPTPSTCCDRSRRTSGASTSRRSSAWARRTRCSSRVGRSRVSGHARSSSRWPVTSRTTFQVSHSS